MNIEDIFGTTEEQTQFDILDKSSSQYRKAQTTNAAIRDELSSRDEDPLTKALSEATHIKEDVKNRYITLAEIYLSDMENNIFRNQFALAKEYPEASADEWNDFLNDRIVKVYITKHKHTLLKTAAEDNLSNPLARNKRDNLKLIENLQAQEQSEADRNIVIMRLPDIYDD